MQLKVFTVFDAEEARRMLKPWREKHPRARIASEKAAPPQEGFGEFKGRQLHQIVVTYEGDGS